MALTIYNTATRKKEEFAPLLAGEARMYVCGPTVYDYLHVGNFRGAIFFNLVRNWLEKKGLKVTLVYNYTDVDDKIIQRAQKENVDTSVITEKYIMEFEKDFGALKLKKHDHNPRVSAYIGPIIKIIQKLIDNGHAYVVNGEVIYSIKTFTEYGKLSHKPLEDLQAGIRVEIDSKKENPLDFALWKPAKPGEPKWPSPWGEGRPGWHIECSAMSSELLGDSFDIHGGGVDLIFPHHENEIAQSEGAAHKPFARYWMHNNFINFGAHKMSKSLGNIMTGRSFMERYNPEVLKMLILSAHYRSLSDFAEAPIQHAVSSLARVYSALARAEVQLTESHAGVSAASASASGPVKTMAIAIETASKGIGEALDDDFNTPEVFARIFEVVRTYNTICRPMSKVTAESVETSRLFKKFVLENGQLMSLYQEPPVGFLTQLDDMLLKNKNLERSQIEVLFQERFRARTEKDFAKSDELRDKLVAMGIAIQDGPQGSSWEVQK